VNEKEEQKLNIKTLTLSFENTEYIAFPMATVASCHLHDVRQTVTVTQDGLVVNEVIHVFDLRLKAEANEVAYMHWPHADGPFPRIQQFDDISHLDVSFDDGSVRSYSVAWQETTDLSNHKQSSRLEQGTLWITLRP